jgi:hypothetical protein
MDIRRKMEDSYKKLNYVRPDVKTKEFILNLCRALSYDESMNLVNIDGYTITRIRGTEENIDTHNIGWLKPLTAKVDQFMIEDSSYPTRSLLGDTPSAEKTTPVRIR